VLGELSSGVTWKVTTSSFKRYYIIHTPYIFQEIRLRNWVHLFESRSNSHCCTDLLKFNGKFLHTFVSFSTFFHVHFCGFFFTALSIQRFYSVNEFLVRRTIIPFSSSLSRTLNSLNKHVLKPILNSSTILFILFWYGWKYNKWFWCRHYKFYVSFPWKYVIPSNLKTFSCLD